jgi:hypothetical protein
MVKQMQRIVQGLNLLLNFTRNATMAATMAAVSFLLGQWPNGHIRRRPALHKSLTRLRWVFDWPATVVIAGHCIAFISHDICLFAT